MAGVANLVYFGLDASHASPVGESTRNADHRSRSTSARKRYPGSLRVDAYDGKFTSRACTYPFCAPPLRAGVGLGHTLSNERFCTTGFMARGRGPNDYLFQMTAGHCDVGAGQWRSRTALGAPFQIIGPGHHFYVGLYGDVGIYRVSNNGYWNARSWAFVTQSAETTQNEEYRIVADAGPTLGSYVCTTGSFWGVTDCGYVTEADVYNSTTGTGDLSARASAAPKETVALPYTSLELRLESTSREPDATVSMSVLRWPRT